MTDLTHKIIDAIIRTESFINDYPNPGVIFLSLDRLFKNPSIRNTIAKAVIAAVDPTSFDAVASIASRGYLFSEMLVNRFSDKGENLIQKAKKRDIDNFVQVDIKTEYSKDTLQVRKGTIEPGKKYLLVDDLIATGGSVLAAIELIKKNGGKIDTVFVMTELLDFKAREMLKKAGIELISLLKLTQNDLQKLLVAQQHHQQNASAPVTYQLSHYNSDEQLPVLNIHLASESPLKLEAVEKACKEKFAHQTIEVVGHNVTSNVNEQPMGYEETKQVAFNRLKDIKSADISPSAILVSIENGIRYDEIERCYYDFIQVIVEKNKEVITHTQDCCKIPSEIMDAIDKSKGETWGQTAKRLGLSRETNNPHQEAIFGGISRTQHIYQALMKTLNQLKENVHRQENINNEDQKLTLNRLVTLNHNKIKSRFARKGIFFSTFQEATTNDSLNLYNHGCPVERWHIDPKKLERNTFKIFSTGDPFSVVAPDVEFTGKNINIHVGLEHAIYSPLALLQEAFQLCRNAYEHGAGRITIALPEILHPILHANDFNFLLMKQFKASGANKVYFYDENYRGLLDQTNVDANIPVTITQQSEIENYQISQQSLLEYLAPQTPAANPLDMQVMGVMRTHTLNNFKSKSEVKSKFNETKPMRTSEIIVPEISKPLHVLICCSRNRAFAEKIAEKLRMQGEKVNIYYTQGKGEQAKIPSDAMICGAVVTIIQSTRPNPIEIEEIKEYEKNGASAYFFEATMIARQAHLRGASQINFINPYQFNARSDKAEDNPKGKTGAYVQQNGMLLEASGINRVITAECHDTHTMSGAYTGKKIKGVAISALTVLSTKIATAWMNDPNHHPEAQLRLVTPDAGATKRTNELTMQLQTIMGKTLCGSRILGEKQRNSHQDDSALINSLNSGDVSINARDKYLITDDETATGNTLCQAIKNLKSNGANDISVVVIHNNMPLNWLTRQLCLARFLYLGVNDFHFSDTQEMGPLAKNYNDLIETQIKMSSLTPEVIEEQVFAWFKENIAKGFSNQKPNYLQQEFIQFKSLFDQLQSRIKIHSLASEFAKSVLTNPDSLKTESTYISQATLFSPSRALNTEKRSITVNANQRAALN